MIYTVGGIKGGSGKSTIATNLVVWLAKKTADVLLVDADDQETSTQFVANRQVTLAIAKAMDPETTQDLTGFTSIKLTGAAVFREIHKLRSKYEHIVIDTGGRDTASQRSALAITDVYLLPFLPRSWDLWTIDPVAKLVEQIQAIRGGNPMEVYSFLNRADTRGKDNAETAKELQAVEGIKYLPHAISSRKAFPNAGGQGLAVSELTPADKKAAEEIEALFSSIIITQKV